MRVCVLLIFVVLIVSPVSAEFFPNISAIPPSLIRNATRTLWDAFHNLTGCHAGDKVNGLSKLKQYFQKFGYIPENFAGNFTDDFDEMLESAIRAYQRNFRLNVTGQLDDLTLRHVVMPRCGNPDVVNGKSTMHGSRKYEIGHGHGHGIHTVGHYTFFPGTPRWPSNRRDLSYAFQPENQLTEDVKSVFARAFERWAAVTKLTFTRVDSLFAADITIGFFSGDHGDGEPFDGVLGTLAHAFSPPSGRFHLDEAENWVVSGDLNSLLPATSAVDLESVAVHEIGHLLGLGHSSVEDAIMYPTISTGKRKVELTADDVEGVQVLYGANPNYNGSTSTPSTHQRDTGDFGGADSAYGGRPGLGLFMGLGFVLWAFS